MTFGLMSRPIRKRVFASAACLLVALLGAVSVAHAQSACGSPGAGSCLQIHQSAGCSNQSCCQVVCGLVPDCCTVGWDTTCVELANSECPFLCGASGAGDCRVAHATPACNNEACCTTVCNIDPGCCQFQWDLICAFEAQLYCAPPPPVPCGAPNAGSCVIPHGTPACNNLACCNTVCSFSPSCCSQAWDVVCVQLANAYCFGCTVNCPGGGIAEVESCGVRANDACVAGQTPQAMTCGTTICGTLDGAIQDGAWVGDRDAYSFTAVDTDGDGTVRITLRLTPEFKAFAALVPATCPVVLGSALASVNAQDCVQSSVSACVPPGNYRIIVAPGTFPNVGLTSALDCNTVPRYSLALECSQVTCGSPCAPNSGSCYAVHNNPGCDEPACCATVCAADPYCCTVAWDTSCVRRAGQTCGLPVPPNDDCAGALPIASGDTLPLNTVAATISTPPVPASCEEGQGVLIGPDLWYRYTAACGGVVAVDTCGSATNLRLVVYGGECGALQPIACNTDSVICVPTGGARAQFVATCGNTYLIRVGGNSPSHLGTGQITLNCPGPACPGPCPADFNGDGAVTGADLGMLLADWGGFQHDLTGDGIVSGADLGALLAVWGPCPR
jgi:hypothetical protein